MTLARRSQLAVVCAVVACVIAMVPRVASATPPHLWWAEDLVNNIAPEDNDYGSSPTYITWLGTDAAARYSHRTTCNSFITTLLKQAYGLSDKDMTNWFGVRSPNATQYHQAITSAYGFVHLPTLDVVQPGDIIAIIYPEGSSANGHVAMVQSAPIFHPATPPYVIGTSQFEVAIIDSTRTAHGWGDTRMTASGTTNGGAGFGVMRLYTNAALQVVGHTWSAMAGTSYRDVTSYPIAIGRLD